MKKLILKLDDADHESIMEAIAIRKSGLFRIQGELILPASESDPKAALVAEICRGWVEGFSLAESERILNGHADKTSLPIRKPAGA